MGRPLKIVNGLKQCTGCKEWKPLDNFHLNKPYYQSKCKNCQKEDYKLWYKQNPDKVKKRNLIANTEYDKSIYRKKNLKKYSDAVARYAKRNPEKVKALLLKWKKSNPEKCKIWSRIATTKRRQILKGLKPNRDYKPVDILEILWRQGSRCYYCGCDISDSYTIDHYIPISLGGEDKLSNIVLSCQMCNSKKSNKKPELFVEELRNN